LDQKKYTIMLRIVQERRKMKDIKESEQDFGKKDRKELSQTSLKEMDKFWEQAKNKVL